MAAHNRQAPGHHILAPARSPSVASTSAGVRTPRPAVGSSRLRRAFLETTAIVGISIGVAAALPASVLAGSLAATPAMAGRRQRWQ